MNILITPKSPYRYDAMEIETNFDKKISNTEAQQLPLPNELIVKILHNLPDFEDRFNFSLTCREIREIVCAEEKPLRVNQIRSSINSVKPFFDEKRLDNLSQVLHNFDEDENFNFIKLSRAAIKIELLVMDYIDRQYLESIPNLSSIEMFTFIKLFFPKDIKHLILIHFFKRHPYLSSSEFNTIITYAGDYEKFRKIIRLAELLVSDDGFVRRNIVSTFLHNYEGEEKVLKLIELSSSSEECLSLIHPYLISIIESHIKSGEEENLQEAIRLALLLPDLSWKYYALEPIISFFLNNNSKKGLQRACELACSFRVEKLKYSALEPIIRTLTHRGDIENLREVAKLGLDEGFQKYVMECIDKISNRA